MSGAKRSTTNYSDEDMIWSLLLKNHGLSKTEVEQELGIPETTFRGWLDGRKEKYQDHREAADAIYRLYLQLSTSAHLLPDERRPKNDHLLLENDNVFTVNPNQLPRNKPTNSPFAKLWILLKLFCDFPEKDVCSEVGLAEAELINWLEEDRNFKIYNKHANLVEKLFDEQAVRGQSLEEKQELLRRVYDDYLCHGDTRELCKLHPDQTPIDPAVFNKSPAKHIDSPVQAVPTENANDSVTPTATASSQKEPSRKSKSQALIEVEESNQFANSAYSNANDNATKENNDGKKDYDASPGILD